MTLTDENMEVLKRPFDVSDHEFLNGMAYITEYAITERIEEVDPAWSFERVGDPVYSDGDQITIFMSMTVCGSTRTNAGTATITRNKNGDVYGEAVKSATTDALKRCARLFGVGRYLLKLGSDVKNAQSLERWFNQQNGTTPTPSPRTTDPKTTPLSASSNGPRRTPQPQPAPVPQGSNKPTYEIGKVYNAVLPLFDNVAPHMKNAITKLCAEGAIVATMTTEEAIAAIEAKYAQDKAS